MRRKPALFYVTVFVGLAAGVGSQTLSVARAATCESGDRIDGSTAATAKKTIEAAGFRQVHALVKGCDNFWHGIAVKDGSESHIVLTPQREVVREGD